MTDKLAALLHVWESDLQELATYEALSQGGVEAIELRAKMEQLKGCIEQLRTAIARPLPPDVQKQMLNWLANGTHDPAPEKPQPSVFFIGPVHALKYYVSREKLHPDEVVLMYEPHRARGWNPRRTGPMKIVVSGSADWGRAQEVLAELEQRGYSEAPFNVR